MQKKKIENLTNYEVGQILDRIISGKTLAVIIADMLTASINKIVLATFESVINDQSNKTNCFESDDENKI